MTPTGQMLRALGLLALMSGYGLAHLRTAAGTLARLLNPQAGWRELRLGEIAISVPADWSEIEPDASGGFIIHNRPRRFRVDGDAVWYASTIELRIRRQDDGDVTPLAPMTGITRTIETSDGPVLLTLATANGVGPKSHRIGLRVLKSARAVSNGTAIEWESPSPMTGQSP